MTDQSALNHERWSAAGEDLLAEYVRHPTRPVEDVLLTRYADELGGRVLEVGIGSGRLTERLVGLGAQVTGIDVSETMVEHCRRRLPQATFHTMDLADLTAFADSSFDALLAGFNVLDVLGHEQRRDALAGWRRVLAPGGLLVFSSHNRSYSGPMPRPGRIIARHPRNLLDNLRHRRTRLANHARLAPLEQRHADWAIVNDEAHDFSLLHYYVTRDECARQIAAAGFDFVECLDLSGEPVGPGEPAASCPELHYVARCATSA